MKKIFILIFSLVLIGSVKTSYSQVDAISIGLIGTDCDQIIVTWNSTFAFVGQGNNQWTQATLTITWPETALTDANTLQGITPIAPGLSTWQYDGVATLDGGTNTWRRKVILVSGSYTQDIPVGITEIIGIKLGTTGQTGPSTFTIANPFNNTNISSFNYGSNIWNEVFDPATTSSVTFADAVRWNGTRWCGGRSTVYFGEPSSLDQTINCFITGPNGILHEVDARVRDLTVNSGASVTVNPGASLTSYRAVNVSGANGLNVAADATGTGSFISRTGSGAALNYLGAGSSTVQQYFVDNVTQVPFHIHFVGPLVSDFSFLGTEGYDGVYLSAFDLAANQTFAYQYDNTIPDWVNLSDETTPIPMSAGLAISTTTNNPQLLSMTGKMIHGAYDTDNGGSGPSVVNLGWNLIANPYPSGLGVYEVLDENAGVIDEDIYVWEGLNNAEGGNYSAYNYTAGEGTGGLFDGLMGIGQGFFINALSTPVSFTNNNVRFHTSEVLLKNNQLYKLRLSASGNGFKDEFVVHFSEAGSDSYGPGDSDKWPSMYGNATEAWTVSPDNVNLTIQTLSPLGENMVSVPTSFKCGASGTYTINASNFESFDVGTEIYLEDLQVGGDWHNLGVNPVYTFSATPDDAQARFVLHFFGPTSVDDPDDEMADVKDVRIYGYGHDAYIVNFGSETVKEFVAYDLMGRELHRGTLPNNSVNKVQIGEVSAYYIVKVMTKEGNVYTGKVYITK